MPRTSLIEAGGVPNSMRRSVSVLSCAVFLGAAFCANAQSILQEWHGQPDLGFAAAQFGSAVEVLADVDGDGGADLLVGAPFEQQVNKHRYDGAVYVLSGSSAAIIRVHAGGAGDQLGTDLAALDDIDGDGVGDYAAIDGMLAFRDVVTVWSGKSGAVIWRVSADRGIFEYFYGMICVLHDFDGDGVRDLGVSASRNGSNPGASLTILSGRTGALILHWMGSGLGVVTSACRLDDLSGDGVPEFAVGHDHGNGKVEIVDGASYGTITTLMSDPTYGVSFGDRCGQAGDLNGDGIRDIVITDQSFGSASTSWPPPDGRVYFYSGATLTELYHVDGPQPHDPIGYGVISERSDFDFNGDGFSDFAIGCVGPAPFWQFPPTGIYVYSGRTGRILYFLPPDPSLGDEGLGSSLQFHDWNRDGFDDVIGGAFWNNSPTKSIGMVHVFAGNDLFLQMNQISYLAGDSIEAATRGAEPSEWTMLAMIDVNGATTFEQVDLKQLDGYGESVVVDTVPSGVAGMTITLQAFATRPTRKGLAVSDPVVVEFQ